jgi:hypothetical protein
MKKGGWVLINDDYEALYCECGGIVDKDFFCTNCYCSVDPYTQEDDYIIFDKSYLYELPHRENDLGI